MSKKPYIYTGQENLESLKDAKNYNNYLISLVKKEIQTGPNNTPKILDFGAGIGTYADTLKSMGMAVDCIEPDANQAKILEQKGYKVFSDISLAKEKYDVIYAFNVLEHIKDDKKIMQQLARALAKNGRLIIYVPAFQILFTELDRIVEHFRRYRLQDLRRLALQSDLMINQLFYADPLGFFAALAYRLLRGSGQLKPSSVKIYDTALFPLSRLLQLLTFKLFGKNAVLIAQKP